jgi:hypothetical protein
MLKIKTCPTVSCKSYLDTNTIVANLKTLKHLINETLMMGKTILKLSFLQSL